MSNNNTMVKRVGLCTIYLLLCVLLLCTVAGCTHKSVGHEAVYYAKSAIVTTINTTHNYVGFTDIHGDEWFWYCDTTFSPWSLDDEVLLVMYDSGTAYSYDDVITSITTEGIICNTVTQ